MNYKVVYFTRTGTSKRIAEKIADKLSCETIQITDNKNWKGIFGFIKAGYYSSTNRAVDIKTSEKIEADDELVVVSPMWAGGITPAVKKFLETTPIDKVHLVITSNGSTINKRSGYKSVRDIEKNKNNEDLIISDLINSLL